MYNILFVDDELVMRSRLHMLLDWEKLGYHVVGDAIHGEQALDILHAVPVDVVITDIKMPIMDGIRLIGAMAAEGFSPVILVLSGYDDFALVREAFKLGAYDYLLKSDIHEDNMAALMGNIRCLLDEKYAKTGQAPKAFHELDMEAALKSAALGKMPAGSLKLAKQFGLALFEIDGFRHESLRFGPDLEENLVRPMLNFAQQIPRVRKKCKVTDIWPSQYLLYYPMDEGEDATAWQGRLVQLCRQLTSAWKTYMNLTVCAVIGGPCPSSKDFESCFSRLTKWLDMKYMTERDCIVCLDGQTPFDIDRGIRGEVLYASLLAALSSADEFAMAGETKALFARLYAMDFEAARQESLVVIYQVAMLFKRNNEDISDIFGENINYCEKVGRLLTMRELEMWLTNYFRWVMDYMEHKYDRRQADMIERAKRFIWDNYGNPEMTLGIVADYVGLNEKYFSSRFTKETGQTFSNFLARLRIEKAKELMDHTDMKMYEICEHVGYHNVENFNRTFKKLCDMSPSAYKKSKS